MPTAGSWPVDRGVAELSRDRARRNAWLLSVDGVPQSHVDLDDPTDLDFDYVRLIADVVDCSWPERRPVSALHLGGGGCTLARYVDATRPRSRQVVWELDEGIARIAREELELRRHVGVRLRVGDAAAGVGKARGRVDLVVSDVFDRALLPAALTSEEHLRSVAGALVDDGVAVLNIADGPPLPFARAQLATVRAVWPEVLVMADPGILRGRRFGNLVIAASARPLPVDALRRRAARAAGGARLVTGADLDELVGDTRPIAAATAKPGPQPPAAVFGRR